MADYTPERIEFEQAWDGAVDAAGSPVHSYVVTAFEHINHIGGEESFFETTEAYGETTHRTYTREQAEEFYAWLGAKLGK